MIPYGQNPYSFEEYIEKREQYDSFQDNQFFQKVVAHFSGEEVEVLSEKLKTLSLKILSWRGKMDEIARPENHPRIRHYDAHNNRIDRIVRPRETEELEQEIFREALFSKNTTKWEMFAKRFLLHQNGELGIMCPIACTDGLIDLLEHYEDELSKPLKDILHHCKEGDGNSFGIGAQFMSEIQGGSNIPANVLDAVPEGDGYRLYGNKFFCSAAHADYSVVTARIHGTKNIGVFIVPTWLPGDKEKQKRNGHRINRLKWKLGTTELPSAEIQYEGALAYPIGPKENGVAIAVSIVLTKSRIDIGLASGAFMMRAATEAKLYTDFREVFGKKISEFPLAYHQLQEMERTAKRTVAGAFKVYSSYLAANGLSNEKEKFLVRELILLQKIVAAKETVDVLRKTISLFGGHGAIEDFSSIPRLFRDSIVNELWEGPKNVLLAQIHRDLTKSAKWYNIEEFVFDIAGVDKSKELASRLIPVLQKPIFTEFTEENIQAAGEWEQVCEDLFHCYQEIALQELGDAPIGRNLDATKQV
jgi:alkylation response protein AidB-like acyl-CoA dehydrogenase